MALPIHAILNTAKIQTAARGRGKMSRPIQQVSEDWCRRINGCCESHYLGSHNASEQTTQQAPLIGEEDDTGFNISGNAHFCEGL